METTFSAPKEEYNEIKEELNWIKENFNPNSYSLSSLHVYEPRLNQIFNWLRGHDEDEIRNLRISIDSFLTYVGQYKISDGLFKFIVTLSLKRKSKEIFKNCKSINQKKF